MEEYARVGISLTTEDAARLTRVVPRGIRSEFIRQLVSAGLDAVEKAGPAMVGMISSGEIQLELNHSIDQNLIKSKSGER